MELTEQQQRALEHARDLLAEMPHADDTHLMVEWYRMVRLALADVVAEFEDDGGVS